MTDRQWFEISGYLEDLCKGYLKDLEGIEAGYIADLSAKTGRQVTAVWKTDGMFNTWTPCGFQCDGEVEGMELKSLHAPNYWEPNRRTKAGKAWIKYLDSMRKIVEFEAALKSLGLFGKTATNGRAMGWAGIHQIGDRFYLNCPVKLVTPYVWDHQDLRAMTPVEIDRIVADQKVAS